MAKNHAINFFFVCNLKLKRDYCVDIYISLFCVCGKKIILCLLLICLTF